jgi:hypothetical protein
MLPMRARHPYIAPSVIKVAQSILTIQAVQSSTASHGADSPLYYCDKSPGKANHWIARPNQLCFEREENVMV